jgi:hypothetical protein
VRHDAKHGGERAHDPVELDAHGVVEPVDAGIHPIRPRVDPVEPRVDLSNRASIRSRLRRVSSAICSSRTSRSPISEG